MKDLDYFTRQFILTVHENFDLPWEKRKILNYNLFYHPELEVEHLANERIELFLLGFLFDYEFPEYTNKQILEVLSLTNSLDHFLEKLSKYSGHFVIIFKSDKQLILLNDACAQHEVYYDTSFCSLGTQPKLLGKVIPLVPHESSDAIRFYNSSQFLKHRIFIGETSPFQNVHHLLPNHYIDILKKEIIRFFPNKPIESIPINKASHDVRIMLKGYLKAASLRKKLGVGVTAGYDSRVLFLACLDIECTYYVTKLPSMSNKHHDLVVPIKLANTFKKKLNILDDKTEIDDSADQILDASIDFYRPHKRQKDLADHIIINGNISEIARNDYLYYKKISPEQLAILNRTSSCDLARNEFEKWLQNSSNKISRMGYNVLDIFYWEERMAHWVAKEKTEMSALGVTVYSPFCSRKLLTTLLSSPRKYRDYYNNALYKLIMNDFSPKALKIPINPYTKNTIKKVLRSLGILYVYKACTLRRKVLATFGFDPKNYYKT